MLKYYILKISTLILNIRSLETFGRYEILLLSIGIPLALLWCTAGILMVKKNYLRKIILFHHSLF